MTFGETLRSLMRERGLSLRRLAKLSHYDVGYLSKVANGHWTPSRTLAERLDTVLDADGRLLALVSETSSADSRPPCVPHQGPVAPELVMYFLEQLPGHYRADMWLGPRHLIPTVMTQAQLIEELSQAADAPVRQGLFGAGVAYSSLLGWLYQDAGDIDRSAYWRATALDMAHRSGDPQLISYSLTNKAMLAIDLGDGRAVIDYATAAMVDEQRLCSKVRVLALVHQAHGHSLLPGCDRADVDRLLDSAADLIEQVDDEYPWGNACHRTRNYIDVQRATAYVRLGVYREAADLWEQILGAAPGSARRDDGVFWARQASALAALSEPERVIEIAASTAPIVNGTGSARLRRELKALPTQAERWRESRHGRELVEIISGIV
ncbi:helix-turn-helix domain-containing protein [Thermomonospora cellulosilytica]|uniref:Transcriptional regulator with XRE-family HTH domain n=1 Tax=Thermomonospora cellulosilytica TaxID=1411118 RepID=A0A7W3MTN9_9ACTN|nr:helix-turn-helix transcriptional regulator [Thermomonospora cellulosilytica]MBA9001659.1 transcriptional regulator with XRE-family HTH domain [Thermomonospora cellulosilytica]